MLILGIESSCDETAASVAEDYTKIRSNVVASQVKEHQLYGGVVPEIASRRHCENVLPVVQKALDDAQVTLADLDGIAVTYAPGLIGALLVGVNFAKGLALATGKPLVPVHHLAGHIAANYIAHPEFGIGQNFYNMAVSATCHQAEIRRFQFRMGNIIRCNVSG